MNKQEEFMVSILVENYPGVLSQIVRLFSRKGYNIQSVAVDTTEDPDITRITIITFGDETSEQLILNQLRKQVSVIAAKLLEKENCVTRELMMIKLKSETKEVRDEIIQIVNIFRANIVDIKQDCLTVAATGDVEKIEAFLKMVMPFGILELVRSGTIALERGKTTILTDQQ